MSFDSNGCASGLVLQAITPGTGLDLRDGPGTHFAAPHSLSMQCPNRLHSRPMQPLAYAANLPSCRTHNMRRPACTSRLLTSIGRW